MAQQSSEWCIIIIIDTQGRVDGDNSCVTDDDWLHKHTQSTQMQWLSMPHMATHKESESERQRENFLLKPNCQKATETPIALRSA